MQSQALRSASYLSVSLLKSRGKGIFILKSSRTVLGRKWNICILCFVSSELEPRDSKALFLACRGRGLCEKLGKISFNSLKCLEGCRNTVEVLVSRVFESRIIVFISIFSQNLAPCMKFTMNILYLGKVLYNSSLTDIEELVYILCPVSRKSQIGCQVTVAHSSPWVSR